ncbi:MAG: hypothetical protein Q8O88_03650 [bacterium]|nr:hypothetical protein [bacterium]
MKTKMKFISLNYQRNGVSGDGFFQLVYSDKYKRTYLFLATFETQNIDGKEERIISTNCRVTNLDDFKLGYRGDNIASEIQNMLDEKVKKLRQTYLDWHKKYKIGFYELTEQGMNIVKEGSK